MFIKVRNQDGKQVLIKKSSIAQIIELESVVIYCRDGVHITVKESFAEIEAMLMAQANLGNMPHGFGKDVGLSRVAEFMEAKARIDVFEKESPFEAAFQYSDLPDGTPMFIESVDHFEFGPSFAATLKGFVGEALTPELVAILEKSGSTVSMNIGGERKKIASGSELLFVTLMAASHIFDGYAENAIECGPMDPLWGATEPVISAFLRWAGSETAVFFGDIIIDGQTDSHTRARSSLENLKVGVFSDIHIMPF